jgi:cytoskeleton protein RodZ
MNTVTEQHADSVGAILRQSREAKGLTAAQVAKQLNLKVAVIEQIEAEQWDPAVSMTFMRGYLRAYARLMKLSELEILQAFELQAAYLRSQPRPMHSFSKKTSLDAAENRFMLATYLLIVLLIGLFLVWFWQTHLLDDAPVSVVPQFDVPVANPATSSAPQEVNNPSLPSSTTAGTEVDASAAQNAATSPLEASDAALTATQIQTPELAAAAPLPASNHPAATQTAEQVETTSNATKPLQSVVQPGQSTDQQPQPQLADAASSVTTSSTSAAQNAGTLAVDTAPALPESSAAASTTSNNSTSTEVGATANGKLELAFAADCWLEVYDKNNQRLAYGSQAAGQKLALQGELPLKIKLGNPPAASMRLNDVVVDLSGYPAGRVARITLTGQL